MPRPCSFGEKGHADLTPGCPFCELYQREERWRLYWDRPDTGRPQKGTRVDSTASVSHGIAIRVQCRNCRTRSEWAWVVLLDGVPQESGQESTEAAARAAAEAEAQALMAARQATR